MRGEADKRSTFNGNSALLEKRHEFDFSAMPELPDKPLNREPGLANLVSSFITYKEGYDRNHCLIPSIKADEHSVQVDGAVKNTLKLSVADLRNEFQQHSVVCALQCAGNRRHTMRTKLKEVSGLDWFDGAVMNCRWTGPRLRDILNRAELSLSDDEQKRAFSAFTCGEALCQEDTWYGASIELQRAMSNDAEVILALEMNDRPLSTEHGFPVRVITPGIAGARAVKWLDRITVQMTESYNHYQQRDYKVLPPEATDAEAAEKFWDLTPGVQAMPVNSVVATPENGSAVQRRADGTINASGYALPSGDDGPITKVEVSGDEGNTWKDADILHHDGESKWSWALWEANVKIEPGKDKAVYSRATDNAGNVQPDEPMWNLRGVCYNGFGEASGLTIN